ncbi:hypothetical protein NM208_g1550 [Fusarium decemcellulare]|uniref:Uncharacterized protein n=1 Tax=Fusarium decemcellulare TaxID=57161 RepID=A0ACC1SVR0_9HYPO|nr:hypothetical protein NM208_g1550 [Fusarium decemcellulare]
MSYNQSMRLEELEAMLEMERREVLELSEEDLSQLLRRKRNDSRDRLTKDYMGPDGEHLGSSDELASSYHEDRGRKKAPRSLNPDAKEESGDKPAENETNLPSNEGGRRAISFLAAAEEERPYHHHPISPRPTQSFMTDTSHIPCKFFRQGACLAGNACPFSHDRSQGTESICKYFAKGNCKFGPKCANIHVLPDGRRINYGKNGVTIGAKPIVAGRTNPTSASNGQFSTSALTTSPYSADVPAYSSTYPFDKQEHNLPRQPNYAPRPRPLPQNPNTPWAQSIMSHTPSLTSSLSSVEPIHRAAITDLKVLLLHQRELEPLYSIAISRVGPEKFQTNLRKLLRRYGKALRKEAANTAQVQAAALVRSASLRLAFEIKEAIFHGAERKGSLEERLRLNDFLRKLKNSVEDHEDLTSSDDESLNGANTDNLQTLETVKNFMISADAFVKLCDEFKEWLKIDDGQKENTINDNAYQAVEGATSESQERPGAVCPLPTPEIVQVGSVAQGDPTFSPQNSQRGSLDIAQCTPEPPRPSPHRWTESALRTLKHVQNVISDFTQTKVAKGVARVSWTCRCGKRLRIELPRSLQTAGLSFAYQAAGSSGASSVFVEISDDDSSSTSSTTHVSTGVGSSLSSNGPPPGLPSIGPSADSSELPEPFIPAGTKKYMLLCVNTDMRLMKLANVDVTDVTDAEEMFKRLRVAYYQLRGPRGRNPLVKPKTMHYVKANWI